MVPLILFFVVFIAVVLISNKTKTNMGVLCMLGAFLLGGWYAGASPSKIVGYFPVNTLSTLFITVTFFGYINQTEMFQGLVNRILYATRGKAWFFPWALFVSTFAICAVGGMDSAPIIISPLAFAISAATGMHPLIAVMTGYMGSIAVGMAPWTPGGQVFSGLMSTGAGERSMTALIMAVVTMAIGSVVLMAIYYFFYGCHKLKGDNFKIDKPKPFNRNQKIALTTLIVVMLLVLVPQVLMNRTSGTISTVCKWLNTHMNIKQNCLIGIFLFSLLKIGSGEKVIREMIPWGIILNIGGTTMLIQCASDMGIITTISSWASTMLPPYLMPFMCVLVAGLLSFVSNAMVILPLFSPVVAEMATLSGLSPVMLCCCLLVGCCATGLSPVSMGGSLHSLGATKEQREAIWGKQWLAAISHFVLYLVLALIGFYPLLARLFGV